MTEETIASSALSPEASLAALDWLIAMGADEALSNDPVDRLAASEQQQKAALERRAATNRPTHSSQAAGQRQRANAAPPIKRGSLKEAKEAASSARTLGELREKLAAFDGGTLKRGAKSCVFADGVETPDIMVIGEAPGRDEDTQGRPFVGLSGQLVDKMLAAIECGRQSNTRLATVIPWRSLGNRSLDTETTALFAPFLKRHIELARPKLVLTFGKVPSLALTDKDEPVSRIRGRVIDLSCGSHDCAIIATYPPEHLLKAPESKRHAWHDLLLAKKTLKEMGCALP